ncbi:MAG: hypothetical protein K1000chlam3_01504 [Chlamydiae bacterium]|nr:hypothetical protein [Chlamydiota bacterium]
MKIVLFLIFSCILVFAEEEAVSEECCPIEECCCYSDSCFSLDRTREDRLSARHLEGTGVGFIRGYTSLDLFLSHCFFENFYPFLDLSGHYFNNAKWAANGGLGFRYLFEDCPFIFGMNAFYDYYKPRRHTYHQIGAGIEWLTSCWSFQINGYFPVSKRKHLIKEGFDTFTGHQAIFERKHEFSFIGTDLEIGRTIYRNSCFDIQGIVGGYYFSGKENKKAGGALLRVEANFSRFLTLNGQGSWDSFFKWRGSGELQFNLPFGPCPKVRSRCFSCCDSIALERKLSKKVRRFEILPTSRNTEKGPALDPLTGKPLNFIFVNNELGSSDGSIKNPYRTLLQAQENSTRGDVLYIFAGDGTTQGMDAGILLQANQRFLGSGTEHVFQTRFGMLSIPQITSISPAIKATFIAVQLSNNCEVSGFRILDTGTGINVNTAKNALITKNAISGEFVSGIAVTNCSGVITIRDNSIISSLPTSTGFGVIVLAEDFSSFTCEIKNNQISGAKIPDVGTFGVGVFAGSFNNSSINMIISENRIFDTRFGIAFESNQDSFATISIEDNKILSSESTGILGDFSSTGNTFLDLSRNLVQGLLSNTNSIDLENTAAGTVSISAKENDLTLNGGSFKIANTSTGVTNATFLNNRSDTDPGYELEQTAGSLNVVENNTGNFSQSGTITIVN